MSWPLVQHPHALADRQPDARPMLDSPIEDAPRLVEVVAAIEHELGSQPISAPLPDLVEVAAVGIERVISFFVGPVPV